MQNTAAKSDLLRAILAGHPPGRPRDVFRTGYHALDELAPDGGLRGGAIHELLFDAPHPAPKTLALFLARSAATAGGGVIVWSDPHRLLHPTALAAAGIDLQKFILLRPKNAAQEISALGECLRCKGVSATVTHLARLSDIDARRLQLAAENGGGVGIFLRPLAGHTATHYAAATRWKVRPALESGDGQSWLIELLHGHGGRFASPVLLEIDRESGLVRISAPLANRPAAAPPARATA